MIAGAWVSGTRRAASGSGAQLPAPVDPAPRGFDPDIPIAGGQSLQAVVDRGADRLRCDHLRLPDVAALGQVLIQAADRHDKSKIEWVP